MSREPSIIASDPDVSAWVAANAGAGKTYTLANRVARLLLNGAPPARILCLTFTKAAAAEMQARLFRQLGEWAMLPDEKLRAGIVKIGGDAHTPLADARRLFAGALETPGGLKILTLHAFCQTVLSRFPVEANAPPGFDVLDEGSARTLIAQARQRVLEQASGGNAHLSAAVALVVSETSETRLTNILNSALGGDRRKLERFLLETDDMPGAVRAAHGLAPTQTMQSIIADFCTGMREQEDTLRSVHAWLSGGSTNDMKAAALLEKTFAALNELSRFHAFGDFLLTGEGVPRKTMATKKLTTARPDLAAWLDQLQEHYLDQLEHYRLARAAELGEAALSIADAVCRYYRDAKRARGVLDYDDLVTKTRDLLHKSGAAGWVLYKLDGGIDHLLIDEAQDTSPEQWDIVRLLTEEFFAGDTARGVTRTVFAVGDEKQSIFSFQGADPAQFETNRRYFSDATAGAGQMLVEPSLETSRRSAPDILSFVDAVFAGDDAHAALTSRTAPIHHTAHRAQAKGGIEFWPPLTPEKTEDSDPWAPVDAVLPTSPVARLATQVAERIHGWLMTGSALPGHDVPIRPGDIMILLPRREPFGSEVIRQLKQRGVPVAGADRMKLTEQIAVMDLMALGRFVLQREDDLNLAALLRSPLCGVSEDDLFALAHDRPADLWAELAARKDEFTDAYTFLAAMLERADFAPPFEFYAHCLTALGGREKLLAREGPESADAIDAFVALTLDYERGAAPSLEGFLDWVARGGTEIKRDMEQGRNEVRVMTVHGAKGLEADIVILPDTTSRPGGLGKHDGLLYGGSVPLFPLPKNDAPAVIQAAKDDADAAITREHRRLLYVALTRARDRLIVCGFTGKTGANDASWYRWMEEAAHELGVEQAEGSHAIGTLAENIVTAPVATPDETPVPHWARTPAPTEPVLPNPIRPSILGLGESLTTQDSAPAPSPLDANRLLRGTLVHTLLARLPEVAPDGRRSLALQFVTAKGFTGAPGEALVAETLAVLDDPSFAPVFGPSSRAEVAIHAARPDLGLKAPITGRIDRLAVGPDQVTILDFKTSHSVPRTADEVSPTILDQMALYRAAAQAVFPGKPVVCGLVFTDGPRLIALPEALLDARMVDIATRLAAQSDLHTLTHAQALPR